MVIEKTLFEKWSSQLEELKVSERMPFEQLVSQLQMLVSDMDNNKNIILKDVLVDFGSLQETYKSTRRAEPILDVMYRQMEILTVYKNKKDGLSRTSWEICYEMLTDKAMNNPHWEGPLELANALNALVDDEIGLTQEKVRAIEKQMNKVMKTAKTTIGYGYCTYLANEFEKRIRILNKRLERVVEFDFSTWMKSERKARNLTLSQLAESAGVTASYIHRIEKGARKAPSMPVIKKIAAALNIPFSELSAKLRVDSEEAPNESKELLDILENSPLTLREKALTPEMKKHLASIIEQMVTVQVESEDTQAVETAENNKLLKTIQQFQSDYERLG